MKICHTYKTFIGMVLILACFNTHAQQLKPEYLEPEVNTSLRELNPIISPDGEALYFTRIIPSGQVAKEIIYRSKKLPNGNWAEAQQMPENFQRIDFNALLSISADGNMALIRGAFENGVYTGRGYSVLYRENKGWSKPEALEIKNYRKMDNGVYSGAILSTDGQTLLMYFGELPGMENSDIYFSHLRDDGTWTKPKSLGKTINTRRYDEISPFLAADNKSLYFASDRPGGIGKHDIYLSKRLDDSWEKWSEPVNLGSPINTVGWEAYYSISALGDFAYMTSAKGKDQLEDIVRIPLKKEFRPNPVVLIYGKAIDSKQNKPLNAKIIYEQLPGGEKSGQTTSNPNDGSYKIILPFGYKYGIIAQAEGYYSINESLDLTTESEYREIQKNLRLFPIETGQTFRINNIFFDLDKSELKPASYPELNRIVRLLQEQPALEIEIAGHTDDLGTAEYNLALSQSRAEAVKSYLTSKGIKANRISAKGFGETKAIAPNSTEEGRATNRRVEFTILKN